MYPPFAAKMARKGYQEHPDLIPTSDELVGMRIRGVLDEAGYLNKMGQAGINPGVANGLLASAKTYLTGIDYIGLWRRGDLTEEATDKLLGEIAFAPDEIVRLKQMTLYLPTPQDVIRLAVRDAYSPATIAQYGSDQDIPPDYFKHALAVGLPEDTAKRFWYAHWELPSPTQAYAMLHRGLITDEELRTYLRVADYLPFWRDKLAAISYNVLGRIDIRRMHAMGILSDAEVLTSYKEEGYNERDAQRLTDFTIQLNHGKDGDTPKTVTISSYKAGLIDHDQAVKQLEDLKLDGQTIVTLLELADQSIAQELIDLKANDIIDQFNAGAMPIEEVYLKLTQLGVPARLMEVTIARELAQAKKRTKVASKADLDKWLLHGLISEDTFRGKMKLIGYTPNDISLYFAEIELEIVQGADKKLPYAIPMRAFQDGNLDESGLRMELSIAGYSGDRLDTVIALALSTKG